MPMTLLGFNTIIFGSWTFPEAYKLPTSPPKNAVAVEPLENDIKQKILQKGSIRLILCT